jgi:hypothetical protein
MRSAPLAALVLVAALAGCASQTTPGAAPPPPTASATPTAAPGDPVDLVGLWEVTETEGLEDGTLVRLAPYEVAIDTPCGVTGAAWAATGDAFVLHTTAYHPCEDAGPTDGPPVIPGLEDAAAYVIEGDEVRLLDIDGSPVGHLTAVTGSEDQLPPLVPDADPGLVQAPGDLPPGLRAPTADELVGRWVAADRSIGTDPYVELRADRTWSGSDGCNGGAGGWLLGTGGWLATSDIGTTFALCAGAPLPSWLVASRLAGFDGTTLVLLDRAGQETGRLVRG